MYTHTDMYMDVCVCHDTHGKVREQLVGVNSLLSPCGSEGLNSHHQTWYRDLHLLSQPSGWPFIKLLLLLCVHYVCYEEGSSMCVRSEDNFVEWVLSFHFQLGLQGSNQVTRLGRWPSPSEPPHHPKATTTSPPPFLFLFFSFCCCWDRVSL